MLLISSCKEQEGQPWPPEVQEVPGNSPVRSPQEALKTFYLPPGYDIEVVASEPLVVNPVAIDFDADGRLWVLEMRSYMPDINAEGEKNHQAKSLSLKIRPVTGGWINERFIWMSWF